MTVEGNATPAQSKTFEALIRLIAFYLPQFHPIPENDEWWGQGFTEWTNVTKARPLFPGHYQPRLPADLGFYDLRLPEAREAQAQLAREYGIHGFCYYHYWFNGRRLLERPFNEVLASGKPDLPFCLCWANENWTRVWDGGNKNMLMEQHYHEDDDREHLRALAPAFMDPRYIRVDGKPLFAIYRAGLLPDPRRTTEVWREEAARLGVGDIFLCRVDSNFGGERGDPRELGFDAAIEFQPDTIELWHRSRDTPANILEIPAWAWMRGSRWLRPKLGWSPGHHYYDYRRIPQMMLRRPPVPYPRFPCVTPSWDNSARRKSNAVILKHASPAIYEEWLREVVLRVATSAEPNKLVFINAWNEWAEGNHLEPCKKWGRAYLEATRDALQSARSSPLEPNSSPPTGG